MTQFRFRKVFEKTKGHCHFCGDPLIFHRRGWRAKNLSGFWEVDHIVQREKGGANLADNYLPACTRCNRLRWHRKGEDIRRILLLGLVAETEIRRKSVTGKTLEKLRKMRMTHNRLRRA